MLRMFVIVMPFDGIGGSQASSAYVRSLFQFPLSVEVVSPRTAWCGKNEQSLWSEEVHSTPARYGVLSLVGCSVLVPVVLGDFLVADDLVSYIPVPFRLESRQVLCPQVENHMRLIVS